MRELHVSALRRLQLCFDFDPHVEVGLDPQAEVGSCGPLGLDFEPLADMCFGPHADAEMCIDPQSEVG